MTVNVTTLTLESTTPTLVTVDLESTTPTPTSTPTLDLTTHYQQQQMNKQFKQEIEANKKFYGIHEFLYYYTFLHAEL